MARYATVAELDRRRQVADRLAWERWQEVGTERDAEYLRLVNRSYHLSEAIARRLEPTEEW